MRKRKEQLGIDFRERKQKFLELFAGETKQVRDSIAEDIVAYNALLSIHAESFEEVVLRQLAKERNISYNRGDPPVPACPFCGELHRVHKKERTIYICRNCKKTFTANYKSISSGTKKDAIVWMKLLHCLLESFSVGKTCRYCGFESRNTYYSMRTRLFYAMQCLLEDIRLYGNIEVDETFVRTSYKGIDLKFIDYPEDSIFVDTQDIKPRDARKRGQPNSLSEKTRNSICIFAAIDDHGHTVVRFAGVGNASHQTLLHYVPPNLYLNEVPEKDPFLFTKKQEKEPETVANDPSLMIADGSKVLEAYARAMDFDFEGHVYRRNGAQLKLPADAHNIQRVNSLHHRLKAFLRKSGYVSSRYLPGYLTLFSFIENTGASQEAIAELFRILAKPNGGKSATFYEELYQVPNYMIEWLRLDNPLRKFPESNILAFWMYYQLKHKDQFPKVSFNLKDISEETGYSEAYIRKLYRNFVKAGYTDLIVQYYGQCSAVEQKKDGSLSFPKKKGTRYSTKTFNPQVLAIYDEYAANRLLPPEERLSLKAFLEIKNKEYGTNYTRTNMHMKFDEICKKGVRPPIVDANFKKSENDITFPRKAFSMARDYDNIQLSYRKRGEKLPSKTEILSTLSQKYGLSPTTIEGYIVRAKKYLREKNVSIDKMLPR